MLKQEHNSVERLALKKMHWDLSEMTEMIQVSVQYM